MKKKRKQVSTPTPQPYRTTSRDGVFSEWDRKAPNIRVTKTLIKRFFIEHLPFITVVFLATAVIYGNSLNGEFLIADDIPGLVQNPVVTDWNKALETGKINIIFDSALLHIGKETPQIFHLRSVLLHGINAILVYFLAAFIFSRPISLTASLLFLAHPVNTEAVSWISAWIYLALTMFTLLVTIFFLLYRKTGQKAFMAVSISLVAIYSLFFTDNWVFTIPFIVIIVDQFLIEKRLNIKVAKNYLPLLILGGLHALYLVTTALSKRIADLKNLYYNDIAQATPFEQRVPYTGFMTWKQYVWPKDLTIYHEGYLINDTYFVLMVITFLTVTGLTVYFFFRNKPFSGLLLLIWVSILPSFSPVPVAWLMADRYLYRGTMFFAMLIAFTAYYIEKKYSLKNFLKITGIVLFVAFSLRTINRNADWRNDKNLWLSTLKVSPYSARVYNNLGDVYFKEKNYDKAIEHFQIALQLKPDFADVVHNLGYIYLEMGNIDLARQYLLKSYEMNPYLYQSLYKLGFLEYKLGNLDLSEQYFAKTLEVNPAFEPAGKALQAIQTLKLQQGSDEETIK